MYIKKITLCFLIIFLICLNLTSCNSIKDEREVAIKTVVNQLFTGPDNELALIDIANKLSDSVLETIGNNEANDLGLYNYDDKEFKEEVNKIYGEYMTEDFIMYGISTRLFTKYSFVYDFDYKMNADNIKISQSDSQTKNQYTYKLIIILEDKKGKTLETNITGSVEFEEGSTKMNYLKVLDSNINKLLK